MGREVEGGEWFLVQRGYGERWSNGERCEYGCDEGEGGQWDYGDFGQGGGVHRCRVEVQQLQGQRVVERLQRQRLARRQGVVERLDHPVSQQDLLRVALGWEVSTPMSRALVMGRDKLPLPSSLRHPALFDSCPPWALSHGALVHYLLMLRQCICSIVIISHIDISGRIAHHHHTQRSRTQKSKESQKIVHLLPLPLLHSLGFFRLIAVMKTLAEQPRLSLYSVRHL